MGAGQHPSQVIQPELSGLAPALVFHGQLLQEAQHDLRVVVGLGEHRG
jgi:hypothetical protein